MFLILLLVKSIIIIIIINTNLIVLIVQHLFMLFVLHLFVLFVLLLLNNNNNNIAHFKIIFIRICSSNHILVLIGFLLFILCKWNVRFMQMKVHFCDSSNTSQHISTYSELNNL